MQSKNTFQRAVLSNGIPVVMEPMRNVRSVALGIWVCVGSRREAPEKNGISHFLEHMFFKGTKRRTAEAIAVEIDSMGGEINAFTSKEGTTFYVKVIDETLGQGLDLLADIFLNSTLPVQEIEREKGVVLEEIKMVEDTPDDLVHDLFCKSIWGNQGIGQPVLGRVKTVKSFTRDDLTGHVKRFYSARNVIISCAGNFKPDSLLTELESRLSAVKKGSPIPGNSKPVFNGAVECHTREQAEVHVCMGVEGVAQSSQERYPALLLNTILGGGISSRLFQEIREKRGLVYSIYSFLSSYRDIGMWGMYAGASKKNVNEVISRSAQEFMRLPETITAEELERAKMQVKGSVVFGLESTTRRMQNLANQEIYYGKHFTPTEVMKAIDAVSLEETSALARKLVNKEKFSLTVLGPVKRDKLKVPFKG